MLWKEEKAAEADHGFQSWFGCHKKYPCMWNALISACLTLLISGRRGQITPVIHETLSVLPEGQIKVSGPWRLFQICPCGCDGCRSLTALDSFSSLPNSLQSTGTPSTTTSLSWLEAPERRHIQSDSFQTVVFCSYKDLELPWLLASLELT